jgi:aspartyl protease family protein
MSVMRYALKEAGTWLVCAGCAVAGIVYFDELKGATAAAFGIALPPPGSETPIDAQRGAQSQSGVARASVSGSVELRAGANGHFETAAQINGREISVMVDTGASLIALTYEDAERAGIYVRASDFTHRSQTANGIAKFAPVMLDRVSIGDITVRNVQAAVSEPGKLRTTLLGMSFLGKLSRTEMRRGGVLVLQE